MKTTSLIRHTLALFLATPALVRAATIGGDPVPNTAAVPASGSDPAIPAEGGIGYKNSITLANNDSASITGTVGAWSWEDQGLFTAGEDPVGWTHQSHWFALSLTEATILNLTYGAEAGVPRPIAGNPANIAGIDQMFPSFTLFTGWDNDGGNNHVYNNDGVLGTDPVKNAQNNWFEDLTYLDHLGNSTLTSVSRSWSLAAGTYTLVIGSNASATTKPDPQGYRLTLSTVPEPTAATLACLALCLTNLTRRRRRK